MARAHPVTEQHPSLYERDFYLWIEEQTRLLRQGALDAPGCRQPGRGDRGFGHRREEGREEQSRGRAPASPQAPVPTPPSEPELAGEHRRASPAPQGRLAHESRASEAMPETCLWTPTPTHAPAPVPRQGCPRGAFPEHLTLLAGADPRPGVPPGLSRRAPQVGGRFRAAAFDNASLEPCRIRRVARPCGGAGGSRRATAPRSRP